MKRKLLLVIVFVSGGIYLFTGKEAQTMPQDPLALYKGNNCVDCHSKLMNPLRLTSRYGEWHISLHKDKGVGCDKCHGGNPEIRDLKAAHEGVLPTKEAASRLNPKNLPQTCSACHGEITGTFTESKHYQNLQSVGLGPSCSTCHAHMASEVIYSADQAAELCASCHDTSNTLLPKRPEIPLQASDAMQAIRRANLVVLWAGRLLEEARNRKMDTEDAEKEMKIVRAVLKEAKVGFHAFNMEVIRRKADDAFESGTKVKDEWRAKLYPGN